MNDPYDTEAQDFLDYLSGYSLVNHVHEPTHRLGNTLDLFITRQDSDLLKNLTVDCQFSDHHLIRCLLNVYKPPAIKKQVTFRKYKQVDMALFSEQLSDRISNLPVFSVPGSMVRAYTSTVTELMNVHAPLINRTVGDRAPSPWITDAIRQEIKVRRQCEKVWLQNKNDTNRDNFIMQRNKVTAMTKDAQSVFWKDRVQQNASKPKKLFKDMEHLLHRKGTTSILPPHDSEADLSDEFIDFFSGKIETIRSALDLQTGHNPVPVYQCESSFSEFEPVSEESVSKIIMKSSDSSCDLDPLPTWMLKQTLPHLLTFITALVNLCFKTATMPEELKHGILSPLLKKIGLELIKKNFRPVSNLPFLSKIIEKVAVSQLVDYMLEHKLMEIFQSAYKAFHSTETALVRVLNDLLLAKDDMELSILMLLDLSAAFDTIDHAILLERLAISFGVCGKALDWIKSYLSSRTQSVKIGNHNSKSVPLLFGVPQGSVIGPILFIIYLSPLGDICRKYGLSFHIYADDTQLYISFRPIDSRKVLFSTSGDLQKCLKDIASWMVLNKLKNNGDKLEAMITGTKQQLSKIDFDSVFINDIEVKLSKQVRNLGVIFDSELTMAPQVTSLCRASFLQLRDLRAIRKHLDIDTAHTAVRAFVSSKLDYCNALFYGINKKQLHRLQCVQNVAAKLVKGARKYDHVTPILVELHWLPLAERVEYKCTLLAWKAVNDQAPEYLQELISADDNGRHHRSKDKHLLYDPRTKLVSGGDRSFTKYAPVLWNNLPFYMRVTTDLESFKTDLKTLLFSKAYD